MPTLNPGSDEALALGRLRFGHLRTTPWEPSFVWGRDLTTVADLINRPHEDYPARTNRTYRAIQWALGDPRVRCGVIDQLGIKDIHATIFNDTPHAGLWRTVQVIVGPHRPPPAAEVPRLMRELCDGRPITTLGELAAWFVDFETIHPFEDGNGRVGGVVVAALSRLLDKEDSGWLVAT